MTDRQAFGIDINEYARTGGINYGLVKTHLQAGIYDFLILKAGLGKWPNKIYAEQKQKVEEHGIPYGTYHFLDPRDDMRLQAQKYVEWVGKQPFYIIDIESPQAGVRLPTKAEILTNIKELERLTQQQPVIYSSKQILKSIGFMSEASQFRLWIAMYPYDASKPSKRLPYRYFSDFARDYAGTLPASVVGNELEKNTILWQFSAKGDGPYYIYNQQTADPVYRGGMKDADLNVSIQSRDVFMKSMFGSVSPVESGTQQPSGGTQQPPGGTTPPAQGPRVTYPGMTNQQMIDIIYKAAKPFTSEPWGWIVRAGLEYMAIPAENRAKPYTGPRVEDFPNMLDEEKVAILAAM